MSLNLIVIGNTAIKCESENWKWNLFVDSQVDNIMKVFVHLHKTFEPNIYELEKTGTRRFESKYFTGWGTFTVLFKVQFQNGETKQFEHMLVFNEIGGKTTFYLDCLDKEVKKGAAIYMSPENDYMNVDEPAVEQMKRIEFQKKLSDTDYQEHSSTLFWHGRLYCGNDNVPKITWESDLTPRNDHDAPKWLTASEYRDIEDVMETKLNYLAQLLRLSNRTVIYSGAGISRAAGIGQAARGAGKEGRKGLNALPTFTHYALGTLAKAGYIHGWIQQNHDGLPQKAGFPQESINEIHGSWYDPSNPVVLYSGSLKQEQYPWMVEEANKADLVLVLGTSLGGLNADQVALKTAARSRKDRNYDNGGALGTVMINLQQTEHDGKSTIRIFGQSDNVLERLLEKLNLPTPILKPATFDNEPRVLVPYNEKGERSDTVKMWLDLRNGANVKLTEGHNCQGARQPAYLHIGAEKPCRYQGTLMKNGPGKGIVMKRNNTTIGIDLMIESQHMTLGQWWIDAAVRGGPKTLPIINIDPEIIKNDEQKN